MPPLAPLLAAVRDVADLPPLLHALGWRPVLEPLDARTVVARDGTDDGFAWLAVTGDDAAEAAVRLARAAGLAGRPVAALGLDRAARRLTIAVALPAPAAATFALDAPSGVDVARLARCVPADGALASAARVGRALGGLPADRRFFTAFRRTLDAMAAALPGPAAADVRHAYALLQLVRVLFLYFVQSRGWLDGRPDFLARAVDATLAARRPLHRHLLRTLFFGTLDRPAARRAARARALGRIPYLNGGLFAPHALDRRWPDGPPDAAWRTAFDDLFEGFHFTVREGDSHAIAPDMLGRVFEGVMHPDSRRRSGTFYTPAPLVRTVLEAGLAPVAARRLGCTEAEALARLAARDADVARVLADCRVLDPAVGSGAFLLGALELLTDLRATLGESRAEAKRTILARQLFGVDLEPGAVRLCELRLWLSLLADEPDVPAARVRPLPNLDALVRQGDSLLDPVGPEAPDPAAARTLARLRARVVRTHGDAARSALVQLRRCEHAAAVRTVDLRIRATERRLRELLAEARTPSLLAERRGLDADGRAAVAALRAERRGLRALARRLAEERAVPWFRYETHFADVAAAGGFDLVVGNPPWVRGEALEPALRARLSARYPWFRRPEGVRGFAALPDLATAFAARALELTAPHGAMALLLPAKLASTVWGWRMRAALAGQHTLHRLAAVPPRGAAAFDATVYPLLLVASPPPAPPAQAVALGLAVDAPVRPQAQFGAEPWPLGPGGAAALLAELSVRHAPLGEAVALMLGVKTGCDRAFLVPPSAGLPPALLRPVVRGRDLRPFEAAPREALLLAHDAAGRPLGSVPAAVQAHLAPHAGALARRRDLREAPPWAVCRLAQLGWQHRVAWADIGVALRAAVLPAESLALNTCYVAGCRAPEDAAALAAWLNAPLVGALARIVAPPAAGGAARFGIRTIGALPFPSGALADTELRTLGHARAAPAALDACVQRLLGLSDDHAIALRRWADDDRAQWRRRAC